MRNFWPHRGRSNVGTPQSSATKSGARRHSARRRLLLEPLEPRMCLALEVPAFASLPGADHTIFLDFDGHVTENTNWNSYFNNPSVNSPPYNIDGDSNSFSNGELADIADAWSRVAEDFLPFEVNVTTVDPGVAALSRSGSGDTQWGVRVVITSDTEGTGAGGIAYIDSFNWSNDTPAFVYVTGGKFVAEAASHEVGHSLGLSHDGTSGGEYYYGHGSGATSWAPLMGAGYYAEVTQWDRGEFTGATNGGSSANYGKGPDDIAAIVTYNGFGFRADDHGDSTSSATSLIASGNAVEGSGIVETSSDADLFAFLSGEGLISFDVSPAAVGANLDIRADLLDTDGNVVATANPSATLGVHLEANVPAGVYYLRIDGTGTGNPAANPPTGYSDYGSVGEYAFSGQIVEAGNFVALAVNDVQVDEAAGVAVFAVTLVGTIESDVTVDFSTVADTALADQDFTAVGGTLTFSPGTTTQLITVPILNDSLSESDEQFFVQLSNPSGDTRLSRALGTGTIADDDVSLSIGDAGATEGNPNNGKKNTGPQYKPFTFTVVLSATARGPVQVHWETRGGTALAGSDFVAASGDVRFASGDVAKTLTVNVVMDGNAEPDERFQVVLSAPVGASISDGVGDGVIVDDDTKLRGKPPRIGRASNEFDFNAAPVRDVFAWYGADNAEDHPHHAELMDVLHANDTLTGLLDALNWSSDGERGLMQTPQAPATPIVAHFARLPRPASSDIRLTESAAMPDEPIEAAIESSHENWLDDLALAVASLKSEAST